jgi:small subunit ribosomal protein S6
MPVGSSDPSSGVSAFDCVSVGPFSGLEGLRAEAQRSRERQIMALYEHIYLARQDVTAQQVETMTEQFKAVIEQNGGKVGKIEYWGVKSLAYRIKKNRKAHFTLMNIDAPPAAITEMERQMSINEDILRVITLRVEEHEEGPSAMMRKRDDSEERGDRGDRAERGERRGPRPDRPRRSREDGAVDGGQF